MANLWQNIMNKLGGKDPFKEYAQNMPALQVPQQQPQDDATGGAAPLVTGLQLSNDGLSLNQVDTPPENKTPMVGENVFKRARNGIRNFNLADALLGKQAQETDNVGELDNDTISAGISANPRVGGLFNDLTAGARENFNNSFRGENLFNNQTDDGRQKGFAYRLGEGLGSIGRFLESPAGRGLLVAGAIGATGGDGLSALAYGTSTAMQNQQNRNADNLYRQQLKDNYGYTDEQLNNLRGYVRKDDFQTLANNIYKNQALKVRQDIAGAQDNTKRANMIMQGLNNGTITPDEAKIHMANYGITLDDLQRSNASRNADMNAELLPYKKYALQMAPQIAAGNLGLAQARFAYQQQQDAFDNALKLQKLNGSGLNKADQKAYKENLSTLSDIDAGLKLISENPSAYSFAKGIMGADLANRIDPKGVKTRTQIDNITAVYRKWLTGAQMSDAERKAYERFLPAPTDNAQIVTAKLQGMRDSIERKNNILMQSAKGGQNNNPLGLNL